MPRPRRPTVVREPSALRRPVEHECIEGVSRPISFRNPLGLPAPLTWKQVRSSAHSRRGEARRSPETKAGEADSLGATQKLYIMGPQMIGAACIDGAANFGVACVPFRTSLSYAPR